MHRSTAFPTLTTAVVCCASAHAGGPLTDFSWNQAAGGAFAFRPVPATGNGTLTVTGGDGFGGSELLVASTLYVGYQSNITYTLAGTFTSSSQFTGTLTVAFSPGAGGTCGNCTTQMMGVTATRP